VLIAIFTDIHGNREAFEACLAHARRQPIDRYMFLGDYVGYGADPGFVVDTVKDLVGRGAVALLGNHDSAATGRAENMNSAAAQAIEWTRRQLSPAQIDFLRRRPLIHTDGDRLYVHASADAPQEWDYVLDSGAAERSFAATTARLTLCGHTHVPLLFRLSDGGRAAAFEPTAGAAIPCRDGRMLAVIGAVGQPRDQNPDACYALHDDAAGTLTYVRVPYDIDAAAKKIRAAGLPAMLAARLAFGQ
jgi:diadenosine tetraphosphatase ApaH/serine/threonine PP2A family protein phosphatase